MSVGPAEDPRGRPAAVIGCVVSRDTGVLLVLTDDGPLRATYDARLLGAVARDPRCAPEPGDWVRLRHWPDGPVTVEETCGRPPQRPLATVHPLRPRRRTR